MERDSLPPKVAREYIRKAGGTGLVAANLGVPFDEVVLWTRVGVESVDHSIALVNLAHFGPTRIGRGPRCALVTLDELWAFVRRFPTRAAAAQALGVCDRALRRYLSGERVPPPSASETVLRELALSPDSLPAALDAHAVPEADPPADHVP